MSLTERFKHRLAVAMGRTVHELEATMGVDEWENWILFHRNYDLPDGYLVAAQLGSLVSRVVGGKLKPSDIVPYYESSHAARNDGIRAGLEFAKAYVKIREQSNPEPSRP